MSNMRKEGAIPSFTYFKLFFLILFLLLFPSDIFSVTPLYYHTFAVAEIEAHVEKISIVEIPTIKTNEFMQKRPPEESMFIAKAQKISLRIEKIIRFEQNDTTIPALLEGETIEVTNHFMDQKPPFNVGDKIKTRVRLVLPEEKYNHEDSRKKWWFFPRGEKKDISPPRHPFKGIEIN